MEASRVPKGGGGDPPGIQAPYGRGLGWGRARGAVGPLVPLGWPPLPIYFLRPETPEDRTLFRDLASMPPPPCFQNWEHQKTPFRHPAGGWIVLRELIHHHGHFLDDP